MSKNTDFLNDIDFEDMSDDERDLFSKNVNLNKIDQTKNTNIKKQLKKFKDQNKNYSR